MSLARMNQDACMLKIEDARPTIRVANSAT